MTQRKAAQNMGVSDRWVRALLKRMDGEQDELAQVERFAELLAERANEHRFTVPNGSAGLRPSV